MGVEEIAPFNDFVDLTVFTAPINLVATYGEMARAIEVMDVAAGTVLEVVTGKGNTRNVPVVSVGEYLGVFFTHINAATSVTRLRVYF